MATTWYDKDRYGNGRNSKAVTWIQEELKKREIIELYRILIHDIEGIHALNSIIDSEKIDLTSYRDDILKILEDTEFYRPLEILIKGINWEGYQDKLLQIIEKYGHLEDLPTENINWEGYQERLIQIAEKYGYLEGLPVKNINWEGYQDKLLEIVEGHGYLEGLPTENINWEGYQDKLVQMVEKYGYFHRIPNLDISWEDYQDRLVQIAEKDGYLGVLPTENTTWEGYQERLIQIAEKYGYLEGLPVKNINWEGYQERLIQIAEKYRRFNCLPTENINWEGYQERLIQIAEKYGALEVLPTENINWEGYQERLIQIAEKYETLIVLPTENINWEGYEDKLLQMMEKYAFKSISNARYKTWEDYKEIRLKIIKISNNLADLPSTNSKIIFSDIIEFLKFTNPELYARFQENIGKANPITNDALNRDLFYEIGPFITKNIDDDMTGNYKELLLDIMHRLEFAGGNIQYGIDDTNNQFDSSNVSLTLDKNELFRRVNQLDEKKDSLEISVLLTFYLNKLTKLHEQSIYYNALGDFRYNQEYDEIIKNTPENDLSEEVRKYLDERMKAEQKGYDIVIACKKLREDSNPDVKPEETYLGLKTKMDSDQTDTFYNFLVNVWKPTRLEDGTLPQTKNTHLNAFYNRFNDKITTLIQKGYKLEEIEKIFLFSAKNFETINRGYKIKANLIAQIIKHKEKGAPNILIAYDQKDDNKDHSSIIYIQLDSLLTPVSFHINAQEFNADKTIDRISQDIMNFSNREPKNIAYPITEEEKQQIEKQFSILELINNNEPIFRLRSLRIFDSFTKNIDSYNQFIQNAIKLIFPDNVYEGDPIKIENGNRQIDIELLKRLQQVYINAAPKYNEDKQEEYHIYFQQHPEQMLAMFCSIIMQRAFSKEQKENILKDGIVSEPEAHVVLPTFLTELKSKQTKEEYRTIFSQDFSTIATIFSTPNQYQAQKEKERQELSNRFNSFISTIPDLKQQEELKKLLMELSQSPETVEFLTQNITPSDLAKGKEAIQTSLTQEQDKTLDT